MRSMTVAHRSNTRTGAGDENGLSKKARGVEDRHFSGEDLEDRRQPAQELYMYLGFI